MGKLDFFVDVAGLLIALAVRTGNFEAFFTDNDRLALFDDEAGVFVCEEETELVVRVVEQREGSREGRTTAGVVAAIVRVVEHRCTLELTCRSGIVVVDFSAAREDVTASAVVIFPITNVSERWRAAASSFFSADGDASNESLVFRSRAIGRMADESFS